MNNSILLSSRTSIASGLCKLNKSPIASWPSSQAIQASIPRHPRIEPSSSLSTFLTGDARINSKPDLLISTQNKDYLRCIGSLKTGISSETAEKVKDTPIFDLKLAVLTAALSHEVQQELNTDGTLYTSLDLDGNLVNYFSNPFLNDLYTGQLLVKLIKANNVPDLDYIGKSDPFVKFTLGNLTVSSSTKFDVKMPKWNEDLTLLVKDPASFTLQIEMLDKKNVLKNRELGKNAIDLKNYSDGKSYPIEIKMEGKNGGATVFLELQYKSFEASNKQSNFWFLDLLANFTKNDLPNLPSPISKFLNYLGLAKKEEGKTFTLKDRSSEPKKDRELPPEISDKQIEDLQLMFEDSQNVMKAWALLYASLSPNPLLDSQFQKLAFVNNTVTETQLAVWRNLKLKTAIFTFRGTECSKLQDVLTDLNVQTVSLYEHGLIDFGPRVHKGFFTAIKSVRPILFSYLNTILNSSYDKSDPAYGPEWQKKKWQVIVCGHSLGAALCTLFTNDLVHHELAKPDQYDLTMYNFGSPRVGDSKFVDQFNKSVPNSWRVVNLYDAVPFTPKLRGYRHIPTPVYISSAPSEFANDLKRQEMDEEGYLLLEATALDIAKDIVLGKKDVIKKLLKYEIKFFKDLKSGVATDVHGLNYYYVALLETVLSNIN